MIGDNHKDTALLVGGSRDGERTPHYHHHEILMPKHVIPKEFSKRDGWGISKETEKYVCWNPVYVDSHYNEHKYLVYRHEDITEAQAFRMLIENYSSD